MDGQSALILKELVDMEFKGSITEKNLLAAFAGESQARNRYTFFSSAARKEGFEQISAIFADTADNEKEHAKLFFDHLKGGDAEITAKYPAGIVGTIAQNLKAAAAGEKLEWGTLYPSFAETAEKEGFKDVANTFRRVGSVEAHHERRYLKILESVEKDQVFKKPSPVKWRCRNCGHVMESKEAPLKCPVCAHDRAFFELFSENY